MVRPSNPSSWKERLLNPADAETVPVWVEEAYTALYAEISDPLYPCYFGTTAERTGALYYAYVEQDDLTPLLTILPRFARIVAEAPGRQRHTLAVLFEPSDTDDHRHHGDRAWEAVRFLLDNDPAAWPEDQPRDPHDPRWGFCFGGESYFAFAGAPTYRQRRSRRLGPGLTLFFQPRSAFEGIEGGTVAGTRARRKIRARLEEWDSLPPHPDLRDFGDPDGFEWKQLFLPDDQSLVEGQCPLSTAPPSPGPTAAPPEVRTLVELLRRRAEEAVPGRGYLFLDDGEREGERLDFERLDLRARAIAVELGRRTRPGDRVLLLFAPGLDFVAAFFGCLYASVLAVPAYPPQRGRMERLERLVEDCSPRLALTSATLEQRLDRHRRARSLAPLPDRDRHVRRAGVPVSRPPVVDPPAGTGASPRAGAPGDACR